MDEWSGLNSGTSGSGAAEPRSLSTDVESGEQPSHAFWLFYLLLRPAVFFRSFVVKPSPALTGLAALLLGIAAVIGEIDEQALKAELGPRTSPFDYIEDWPTYWVVCLVAGLLSAFLYFAIGGWWYVKRLKYCGDDDPEKPLARRVYLFASQIYALPIVLYTAWETERYASPAHAYDGDDWIGVVLILFLFWSVYASYRGVRTAFDVRRWKARMWFLILPTALYALGMVGFATAFAVRFGMFDAEPRLDPPNRIVRPAYLLSYPANWQVNTQDPDYDPDAWFTIGPNWVNAGTQITLYDWAVDPEEEAQLTMTSLAESFSIVTTVPANEWGRYKGIGFEFEIEIEGSSFQGRVFVATRAESGFEVLETCERDQVEIQEPGFALIRRSFRLRNQGNSD